MWPFALRWAREPEIAIQRRPGDTDGRGDLRDGRAGGLQAANLGVLDQLGRVLGLARFLRPLLRRGPLRTAVGLQWGRLCALRTGSGHR